MMFFPLKTVGGVLKIHNNLVTRKALRLSVVRRYATINPNANVDETQVEVLEKYKNDWWDRNGPMRALHAYNEIRVPFIKNGLCNTLESLKGQKIDESLPLKNLNILEIGCGGGILTEAISRLGGNVTGVDASQDLVQMASRHASLTNCGNIKYIHSTIEDFCPHHQNKFDSVVISEVLEHIPEKETFIASCVEALKPGGSVFITTFSRTALAWFFGIVMAENVLHCIPKGTHDFKLFISAEGTTELLKKVNCKTILVKGINYNPFINKWYWVNHRQISYGLHAIKNAS